MFAEFNEAGKPKSSLLRNSVKFNDFANPNSWADLDIKIDVWQEL